MRRTWVQRSAAITAMGLVAGCGGDGRLPSSAGRAPVDSGEPVVLEHCGTLEADETWGPPGSTHRVTCDVKVKAGILTIAEGVTVQFEPDTMLRVGAGTAAAGLEVLGTADEPVSLESSADGAGRWAGVQFFNMTSRAVMSHTTVTSAGEDRRGAIDVDSVAATLDHVTVEDALTCGIRILGTGSFAPDSAALRVTTSGGAPVCLPVEATAGLPIDNSDYTGNHTDVITIEGGKLGVPARWDSPGVPYAMEAQLKVSGSAERPAVLTLGPGVEVHFGNDGGLKFSGDGGASGFIAEGSQDTPVLLTGLDSSIRGSWRGVEVHPGVIDGGLVLQHLTLLDAGSRQDAALRIRDTAIAFTSVTVEHCEGVGFGLEGSASIISGSTGLRVEGCERPLALPAGLYGNVPVDSVFIDNDEQMVTLQGSGQVRKSAVWSNLGVPLRIASDIDVEGSADQTTVLELAAGLELRFEANRAFEVAAGGGAAGLVLSGTEAAPVRLLPYASAQAGEWVGLQIHPDAVGAETRLVEFELSGGGGRSADGALSVRGVDATITDGLIRRVPDETCGIHLTDTALVPERITYEDVGGEDLCRE